jgi:hypothetical protein
MATVSELSKLQAVKGLIFGKEIQDYDTEFKNIHALINENKVKGDQDIIDQFKALDNLEKNITARIVRLEAEVMKRIVLLDNKKVDRAKLAKMLIQIGEKRQDA